MADSLLDVGVGEFYFPLSPNWVSLPKNQFLITRYLFEYRGTSALMQTQNVETPFIFEARFDIENKNEEFQIQEFIHNVMGRTKRFWIRYPKNLMDLADDATIGSTQLNIVPDNTNLLFSGYERIYFLMNNDDLITRKVTEAIYDEANDKVNLTLETAIDREIGVDDYYEMGRYLLVRFDSDNFSFTLDTDHKLRFNQKFQELIRDYDDLAPNLKTVTSEEITEK